MHSKNTRKSYCIWLQDTGKLNFSDPQISVEAKHYNKKVNVQGK